MINPQIFISNFSSLGQTLWMSTAVWSSAIAQQLPVIYWVKIIIINHNWQSFHQYLSHISFSALNSLHVCTMKNLIFWYLDLQNVAKNIWEIGPSSFNEMYGNIPKYQLFHNNMTQLLNNMLSFKLINNHSLLFQVTTYNQHFNLKYQLMWQICTYNFTVSVTSHWYQNLHLIMYNCSKVWRNL